MADRYIKTVDGGEFTDEFTSSFGLEIDDGSISYWTKVSNLLQRRNILINGEFIVAQRGTSFTAATTPLNSDDTYLLDRWILLSDGNDIVDVTQSSVVPTGAYRSVKLEVETANKQFGILQIIEGKDAAAIIGGSASLSFQARMAAADDNTHSVKAVVLAWGGTEDSVTSDIVNTWGTTASFVANWTGENTPASLTLTTSWQTFTIENISIDTASAKNVAVFIYCDQTDGALDDAIYITNVKLEKGAAVTEFEHLPFDVTLQSCLRYSQIFGEGDDVMVGQGQAHNATDCFRLLVNLLKPMRAAPTLTFSAASHYDMVAAAGITCTAIALQVGDNQKPVLRATVASGMTTYRMYSLEGNTSSAWMLFESEL